MRMPLTERYRPLRNIIDSYPGRFLLTVSPTSPHSAPGSGCGHAFLGKLALALEHVDSAIHAKGVVNRDMIRERDTGALSISSVPKVAC